MKQVLVEKVELLNILKTNKQLHLDEYEKAEKEFREAGIAALEEMLEKFKTGGDNSLRVPLLAPVCHEEEYDSAIRMLEVSCEDKIALDEHEAQNLIMNNWSWAGELGRTRAMYAQFLKK